MMDEHSSQEGRGVLPGISDGTLCVLVLAVLLVCLLVISSTQQARLPENRTRFSGGMERPSLHLQCTVPAFERTTSDELAMERTLYGGLPYVAVHLFRPPAPPAPSTRPAGKVAPAAHPVPSQQDLSLYQFMQLAPGIDPGSFNAGGQRAALLIPSIMEWQIAYEPGLAAGYRARPERALTEQLLPALWAVYRNPVLADRRGQVIDFVEARVLHCQTVGAHAHDVIGQVVWLPQFFEQLLDRDRVCGQVIDNVDMGVWLLNQLLDQVPADESEPAGD